MVDHHFNTSYIQIDREAIKTNLQFIRDMVGPKVTFSSVVKGNAYGHGIEQFVPLLEEYGQRHFAPFDAYEAYRVKSMLKEPDSVVMILGMVDDAAMEWAVAEGVEFFVFEQGRLEAACRAAKKVGKPARVHLEAETGMNRTGFSFKELQRAVEYVKANPESFEVAGFCTHYAGAESIANYKRVKDQISRYKKLSKWFANQGLKPEKYHSSCSAATVTYPQTTFDMVRIGILQYGFWPNPETFIHFQSKQKKRDLGADGLKRVISWRSKVMSVKEVNVGEFVGYGTSFLAHENVQTATVPVGYAHGYARGLSNSGRVLIGGERFQVISVVNMNMLVVDVSEATKPILPGDEVTLIGNQGEHAITVASFSEMSSQLNYELLTRLPADIPRMVA